MSKKTFIEILGVEYYSEINAHCKKRIGKDIQDIGWRDGTSWLGEISSFLKENFDIGISKKINGPLGGWCQGASINDSSFEIINLSEENTISEKIPQGTRIKRNPKRVLLEVTTSENDLEFCRWLQAVKKAMDYIVEYKGVQKTLFV